MMASYKGSAVWPMLFIRFDAIPAELLQQVRKKLPAPTEPAPKSRQTRMRRPAAADPR